MYNCPSKQILILTDIVIINTIHIVNIVLDIKSKHYKWDIAKMSSVAAVRRCSSKLESIFIKVVGLQTCNFIKKWLWHRYLLMNSAKFLRTVFSIEYLWWLLLYQLEREEDKSVEQRSTEKIFKWKKKMKTFHLTSLASFGASYNRNANATISVSKLLIFFLLIFFKFSFFGFLRVLFLCFYFVWQTEKHPVSH